jgi:hypothetical protein
LERKEVKRLIVVAIAISLLSLQVLAEEPLPCRSAAQESAVIAVIDTVLAVLDKTVKSVPPDQAVYLESHFNTLPQTSRSEVINASRAFASAWAIREKMQAVHSAIRAVSRRAKAADHISALTHLRDTIEPLASAVGNAATSSDAAFNPTNGPDNGVWSSIIELRMINSSLRQCVDFYTAPGRP